MTSALRPYMWVALGGATGATARWSLTASVPTERYLWWILVVNVTGSLLLGIVAGRYAHGTRPPWYPAVGPGFLGGFTTYSATAVAFMEPHASGIVGVGALILTLVIATGAAWGGWAWARTRFRDEEASP